MSADAGIAAMLQTSGAVMLNGAAAPRTAALFRGDTIQTTSGSVTISPPGSSVLVSGNSRVTFRGQALDVNAGVVVVNTTNGMTAQAAVYNVSPAGRGSARFQVARLGEKIFVKSERGALTVSGAGRVMIVSEGSTEALGDDQTPPPAAGRRKGAGIALSGAELVLIGGGIAVAATMIALTTAKKPHPITPVGP
jgi:adhesin HecA-like repeat protein